MRFQIRGLGVSNYFNSSLLFGAGTGGQLREMKECKKSATTLVSFYITDKANWKPESLHFFKLLVPCNVEVTKMFFITLFTDIL